MRKRTQAREYALQILYQNEMNPAASVDEGIDDFWAHHSDVSEEIRVFAAAIARGVIEHLVVIDQTIVRCAQNWDIRRMAVIDRNILRLGAYELLYDSEIPPKVAINEAVNVAKKFSQEDSGKFVNGILDKISHTEIKSSDQQ